MISAALLLMMGVVFFEVAMIASMRLGGLPWRWVWWRWLAWHRLPGGRRFDSKDLTTRERHSLLIANGYTPRTPPEDR